MTRALTVLLLLTAGTAARQPEAPWREAPEFLRLFAPPGARAAAYRAYVSPLDLERSLAGILDDVALLRPPGAWQPQAQLPLDAFGQMGTYDRWALVRLYGARRARVARGPRTADGRVVETWTLISPYPDTTLQRLQTGTLLIVLKVP